MVDRGGRARARGLTLPGLSLSVVPEPAPFLRSPPFPWADAAVGAVSMPGRSSVEDRDALLAAVRTARVGGAFWSPNGDPWRSDVNDEEGALIASIAYGGPDARDRLAATAESARYRDPFTGEAITALAAVTILGEWRRSIEANRGIAAAAGMMAWKRLTMAQFLWDGASNAPFLDASAAMSAALTTSGAVAYWPSRVDPDFARVAARAGVTTWQVEDGFIRSAGLGAECHPPMSVIVDPTGGVYFDPAAPSLVEKILATHDFTPDLLDRAARLRARIIATRIGKYGVDQDSPPPTLPTGRRIVLAIGQVADDLSVLFGGSIAGFLTRVRAEEPDAHIVYRPHPDVVAGLRRGATDGLESVDQIATGGSLLSLIERVDTVHVLSSLTGFEALLRDKPVVVHGMPFYAGWGLTRDLAAAPARRGRALSVDALVAGALILAPRYRDPQTELPCTPEVLVERLARGGTPRRTMLTGFRRALGHTRRSLAMTRGRA